MRSAGARNATSVPGGAWRASSPRRVSARSIPPVFSAAAAAGLPTPLALVARLIHRLEGPVDRQQPAGEPRIHHLFEGVLALPRDEIARQADEILGAFLALQESLEVGGVGAAELLHVDLDHGLNIERLDPPLSHLRRGHGVE